MRISATSSFSSRQVFSSTQAKTQKGALDFSKFSNQALDKLLYDIKNNPDFRESLNKDEIDHSVQNEFDRMDATYTLNRTMEEARARIDRKVTLANIRNEFEPKEKLTCDFLGKKQEVTPLIMATDMEPISLDMYI